MRSLFSQHVQVARCFEFQWYFNNSNLYVDTMYYIYIILYIYIYIFCFCRLHKYEPMEGSKSVMLWSSRCCTTRCRMDSHFQRGAKCPSGAACMVWVDRQTRETTCIVESFGHILSVFLLLLLLCCFYHSHSLRYL